MKDDRPPVPDLEERLRAALRAEAARMRVSPDAWAKVRGRLANRTATPQPRGLLRRHRRGARPGGPGNVRPGGTARDVRRRPPAGPTQDTNAAGWRSRLPRPLVVGAAVLASAAATAGVLLIPHLTTPSPVAGPSPSTSTVAPLSEAGTGTPPRPTPRVTTEESQRPTTLATVTAGADLRLVLDASPDTTGDTTVRLRLLLLKGGAWRPVDEARVLGATSGRSATSPPKVCELTVDTTGDVTGAGAAEGSDSRGPAVRVRLAADASTPCSRAYDFDLRDNRLVPR